MFIATVKCTVNRFYRPIIDVKNIITMFVDTDAHTQRLKVIL